MSSNLLFCLHQDLQAAAPPLACLQQTIMHQSIPSANIPRQTPGEFFEVVKSPVPGQNFSAKTRPPLQKTPTPWEYFRRSSQPFLLTGVKILGFCRTQSLQRIRRLFNYSLVIPSRFSLSTILKSFKVFPQL